MMKAIKVERMLSKNHTADVSILKMDWTGEDSNNSCIPPQTLNLNEAARWVWWCIPGFQD